MSQAIENLDFAATLRAARHQDSGALDALFAGARHDLNLVVSRQFESDLESAEEAGDLVEDTLLEAERRIGAFEGEDPQAFRDWLRSILAEEAAKHMRRKRRMAWRRVSTADSLAQDGAWESTVSISSGPGYSQVTPESPITVDPSIPSGFAGPEEDPGLVSGSLDGAAENRSASIGPSHWIGRFRIMSHLGRGGMGTVYLAQDLRLDRSVAIKVMSEGRSDFESRFEVEIRALARLHHPNIVQVHEAGVDNGVHYLVMEYIPGGTLKKRLDTLHHTPREAAELVSQLAMAAQAAHDVGVVHRDLKPVNVLLTEDGIPKIADFGLAKLLTDPEWPTISGTVVGTPNYMAPEQASGKAKHNEQAMDIYGLGTVLYELLTSRAPFVGAVPADVQLQVLRDDPVPPRRLNPKVPKDLETICLKCMEKLPAQRYASARELAEDLNRFLEGQSILARPVGLSGQAWRWCHRNQRLAATGAGALMLLLTLAVGGPLMALQQAALKAEANRHEKIAEASAIDSRNRLAIARETVGELTNQLYLQLNRSQDLNQIRTGLLGQCVRACDRLLSEAGDDPMLRADTIRVLVMYSQHMRWGEGDRGASVQARRAVLMAEQLTQQFPERPQYRDTLAFAHSNLGDILDAPRDRAECERAWGSAIDEFDALRAANYKPEKTVESIVHILNNRGDRRVDWGDIEGAASDFLRVIDVTRAQVDQGTTNRALLQHHANGWRNLGKMRRGQGRLDESREALRKALSLYRKLADDHPENTGQRVELACGHIELALVAFSAGDPRSAEAELRQSIPLLAFAVEARSDLPEYRIYSLLAKLLFADALREGGKTAEAEPHWQGALVAARSMPAAEVQGLADHLRFIGRKVSAQRFLDDLSQTLPGPPAVLMTKLGHTSDRPLPAP